MAAALEAYTGNQKAGDAKQAKHNRTIRWWTRVATIGGVIYTLVTAVILVATIRSIQEARRATHAASRAASAASAQAEISEDTEKRQLRAYVSVGAPFFDEIDPSIIHIKDRNDGQTPAYHVKGRLNWYWVPFDQKLPSDFSYPDFDTFNPPILSVIALGRDIEKPFDFDFDGTLVRRARSAEITFFVYGHFDYIDVFGKEWTTTFNHQYHPNISSTGQFGHTFTVYPEHNGGT